jgi:hypothetical protein
MATNEEFYRARAEEARAEAEEASLANVRDRCIRSATAWQVMADRAARGERLRAEEQAKRAAAFQRS